MSFRFGWADIRARCKAGEQPRPHPGNRNQDFACECIFLPLDWKKSRFDPPSKTAVSGHLRGLGAWVPHPTWLCLDGDFSFNLIPSNGESEIGWLTRKSDTGNARLLTQAKAAWVGQRAGPALRAQINCEHGEGQQVLSESRN